MLVKRFLVLFLLAASILPANAGSFFDMPRSRTWDGYEVRTGVLYHSILGSTEKSVSINGEFLSPRFGFASNNVLLDFLTRPKLVIGGNANTDNFTSEIYAGLAYELPLYRGFFFEAMFGGAYNDGNVNAPYPVGRLALGCSVQFHQNFSLGYDVNDRFRVMATFDHSSNAGMCDRNQGTNDAGLRIGYKF